jgi:hypothetical protein
MSNANTLNQCRPISPKSAAGFGETRLHYAAGVVFFLAAIVLGGCGPSGPKLAPVEGKVTLKDGTPVEFGYIILHPEVSKENPSLDVCQGTIQQGSYTILTDVRQGAQAGKYRVSIQAAKGIDPTNPYFTEWLADEKYVDPAKSKLTLEVVETPEPGRYDFQLDPHPKQKGQ